MDVTPLLAELNDRQREAVCADSQPILVLAGAGSGKTRVLVHRAAWLIQAQQVPPSQLLAVTFTNKAANEMRERIEALLDMPATSLWVGTFHALAHRLLRMHFEEAGLPKSFQILDADDQLRIVKRVIKDLGLDDSQWDAKKARGFINAKKDEGLYPKHIDPGRDPLQKTLVDIYQRYQSACDQSGLVDFAELLLRAYHLWLDHPEVLQKYQARFRYVLVDEFQDTNTIQYSWLRLLVGEDNLPFVVGDDDQSIYRWRGARVEHIHRFKTDFPDAQVVKLEQNYRSTGNILNAANAVIDHNESRLGKKLWTEGNQGDLLRLYGAYNERDEADFVIGQIKKWVDQGGMRQEAAILYRSNAQSRVFEEALLRAAMPYRVYGGLRFFERAEIKDALAYLRLLVNRDDDASFERVVNKPTRGIGARTVSEVRDLARARQCSMWQASQTVLANHTLTARAENALRAFCDLINTMTDDVEGLTLGEQMDHVVKTSGLLDLYKKERGEKGQTKVENLEELINAAHEFEPEENEDVQLSPLESFLSHAALEAGEAQGAAWEDCVQLMTLHSAKGLEFPLVFLAGVEEGLFPHQRSLNDVDGLEEERRLCYVGITRAMRELYLSHAEYRRLHGSEHHCTPSRFLKEIPSELIEEIRPRARLRRPSSVHRAGNGFASGTTIGKSDMPAGVTLGQRVRHGKFGEGIVLSCEGAGAHTRLQVNFEGIGMKWLVMQYANLELM
ncbi:MAG: DNA helicase II [Gammaproteobacteria bacterium]|nr:DNA helicase II [Gammaproteobacteria bacterium]